MKKNKLLIIIVLLLIIVTGCGKKSDNKETNPKHKTENKNSTDVIVNTNENIIKEQEIDGIKAKNVSLYIEDGISYLSVDMVNDTNGDYTLNEYTLIIKDKDGKEIIKLPGYIGEVIKAGQTKTIKSMTNTDLSKAYSIEYKVNK